MRLDVSHLVVVALAGLVGWWLGRNIQLAGDAN